MSVEKGNVIVVEHEFAAPVAKVFGALKQGRLFFNCGAWPEKTQIDFRPGGKYRLDFAHYGISHGEFTEIIENKRLAFTWNSDAMEAKDTRVSIDLAPSPKGCKVRLRHEGFSDLETAEGHEGGWNAGLTGCDEELTKFRVHIEREIVAPIGMLYEACASLNLFSQMGSIAKSTKLDHPTKVSVEIGPWGEDGKNSYIELTHDGLTSSEAALAQHEAWNLALWSLYQRVCR